MADVNVRAGGPGEYHVEVREGSSVSNHRVGVTGPYRDELGVPEDREQHLVDESFRFLLEREPKESILASFDLSVIARYFPEYPDEIRRRLQA